MIGAFLKPVLKSITKMMPKSLIKGASRAGKLKVRPRLSIGRGANNTEKLLNNDQKENKLNSKITRNESNSELSNLSDELDISSKSISIISNRESRSRRAAKENEATKRRIAKLDNDFQKKLNEINNKYLEISLAIESPEVLGVQKEAEVKKKYLNKRDSIYKKISKYNSNIEELTNDLNILEQSYVNDGISYEEYNNSNSIVNSDIRSNQSLIKIAEDELSKLSIKEDEELSDIPNEIKELAKENAGNKASIEENKNNEILGVTIEYNEERDSLLAKLDRTSRKEIQDNLSDEQSAIQLKARAIAKKKKFADTISRLKGNIVNSRAVQPIHNVIDGVKRISGSISNLYNSTNKSALLIGGISSGVIGLVTALSKIGPENIIELLAFALQPIVKLIKGISQGISDLINKPKEAIKKGIDTVKNWFTGNAGSSIDSGKEKVTYSSNNDGSVRKVVETKVTKKVKDESGNEKVEESWEVTEDKIIASNEEVKRISQETGLGIEEIVKQLQESNRNLSNLSEAIKQVKKEQNKDIERGDVEQSSAKAGAGFKPKKRVKPSTNENDSGDGDQSTSNGPNQLPIDPNLGYLRMVSAFDEARFRKDGSIRHHKGVDISSSPGDKVVSPGDGVITAYARSNAGDKIVVKHDNGDESTFFHNRINSDYGPKGSKVKIGSKVKQGQQIGVVAARGDNNPYPPHIHWELRSPRSSRADKLLDPIKNLLDSDFYDTVTEKKIAQVYNATIDKQNKTSAQKAFNKKVGGGGMLERYAHNVSVKETKPQIGSTSPIKPDNTDEDSGDTPNIPAPVDMDKVKVSGVNKHSSSSNTTNVINVPQKVTVDKSIQRKKVSDKV